MQPTTSTTRNCTSCNSDFTFSDEDKALLEKMTPEFNGEKFSFPEPEKCPDCRKQYRLAHRNEFNLYHRKCDLTGHQLLSAISTDKPYKVYQQSEWWKDTWSAQHFH